MDGGQAREEEIAISIACEADGTMRGLTHAIIEIRQDLIRTEAGANAWAERLAALEGVARKHSLKMITIAALILLIVPYVRTPGLNLMGVLPLPGFERRGLQSDRRGAWAALLIGLIFGLAVGPCTFAYLAPVLAVTFGMADEHLARAVLLLVAFAILTLAGVWFRGTGMVLTWPWKV